MKELKHPRVSEKGQAPAPGATPNANLFLRVCAHFLAEYRKGVEDLEKLLMVPRSSLVSLRERHQTLLRQISGSMKKTEAIKQLRRQTRVAEAFGDELARGYWKVLTTSQTALMNLARLKMEAQVTVARAEEIIATINDWAFSEEYGERISNLQAKQEGIDEDPVKTIQTIEIMEIFGRFRSEATVLEALAKQLVADSLQPMVECLSAELESSGKIVSEIDVSSPGEGNHPSTFEIAEVCDTLAWGLDDVISWNDAVVMGLRGLEAFKEGVDRLEKWISSAWENWGTFGDLE